MIRIFKTLLGVVLGVGVMASPALADPATENVYIREIQSNNKDMIVLRQRDHQLYRFRTSIGCLPLVPFDNKGNRGRFEGNGILVYSGASPFFSMGGGDTLSVIHPMLQVRPKHLDNNLIECQVLRIERFNTDFNDNPLNNKNQQEILK